ncbi:MAG: CoA transferase [Candidatus Methylomirabilia bacterium]
MMSPNLSEPLQDIRVLTLAGNVPGPVAAFRLRRLGAEVTKIEPPEGDPLAQANPAWYDALHEGQQVFRLNLKDPSHRTKLDRLLEQSDLLLTAIRPAGVARLSLGWPELHARYPRLSQVAIVGYPAPRENEPGHDLTYMARLGLLIPPHLPRTLLADLAGAERTVSAALSLLLARERGQGGGYAQVALAEVAASFADPLKYGITAPGGVLGGGLPGYNLYRTQQGWIAVAALEPHFWQRIERELNLISAKREEIEGVFLTQTADYWESWAAERDLPIAALRDVPFQTAG